MHKLGVNFDEISDDLEYSLEVMLDSGIKYGEIRTLNKESFMNWDDRFIDKVQSSALQAGIKIIGAASPLFKWYESENDPDVRFDSFGFDPRLSAGQKLLAAERCVTVAEQLSIPVVRIFSGLGERRKAGEIFADDPVLESLLDLAASKNIEISIENEPPCFIHSQHDIQDLMSIRKEDNFKVWLDIANFFAIGETIDVDFIKSIAPRINYLHIKNYTIKNGERVFGSINNGVIDYENVLKKIFAHIKHDITITLESHAKKDKAETTVKALGELRGILNRIGVNYE